MANIKEPAKVGRKKINREIPEPVMASLEDGPRQLAVASSRENGTGMRRNAASSIPATDRYANLEKGVVPFVYSTGGGNYDSNISLRSTITLCQKAYYNVPIFRNTIDLMTEFSLSNTYLKGGNEQSKKFFDLWLKKINNWNLQEQFYREFYRSGNVMFYKFRADFSRDSMMKIQEAFGAEGEILEDGSKSVAVKYILLNPADINIITSSSFMDNVYVKVLNDFEIQSLLNPKTPMDQKIADSIPEIQKLRKKTNLKSAAPGGYNNITLELDKDRLVAIFYKKQDYEPLAVPMGFAVLEDINSKLELKQIDRAIARSVQQAVLLITMGDEKIGLPSQQNLAAMRKLFENQSVGKVLVADYTTDAKFVLPDIGNLLDPKKYTILDKDIATGLNNILFGDDKFSNTSIKVKVFFARLKYGREKYLRDFLIPEMEAVGKALGFKQIPEPVLEDVDFEDNVLMSRVYSRLIEIGVLTPEEGFSVFDTGRLPTAEESLESQKNYKALRDKGYYQPLVGGAKAAEAGVAGKGGSSKTTSGRPGGTTGIKQAAPRAQRQTGAPKTANASEEFEEGNEELTLLPEVETFSCLKMKDVMASLVKLEKFIGEKMRVSFGIKRMTNDQLGVVADLSLHVIQNEPMEDWELKAENYIKDPTLENPNFANQIDELAAQHGLDNRSAAILFHSKK